MQRTLVLALAAVMMATAAAAQQPGVSDAYRDAAAAELVRLARERRVTTDSRIQRYQTQATERISVGMRVGIGERLLYRRDTASRVDWSRDTVRIEVLGAREVVPMVRGAPQIPAGIGAYVPVMAFDPVDSEMLLRLDSTVIRHPLAAGSEEHYRFQTGDSTVITLPGGRIVRLHELQFRPRRRDHHLITGSFWVEMDTYAVVQAYFRLARGYDSGRDGGGSDIPGFLRPIRGDIDYIAVDYGLWELQWWLPRSVVAHGLIQAGPLRMPLSFERRYDGYTVTGDTAAFLVSGAGAAPVMETRPCRPRTSFTVNVSTTSRPDSVRERRAAEARARRQEQARERRAQRAQQEQDTSSAAAPGDTTNICDREFIVTSVDRAELIDSPFLGGDIYDDTALLDAAEIRALAERVRAIPAPPWQLERPVLQWGLGGPGLVRYNRVEGLSLGARVLLDLGAAEVEAEARFGTADLQPAAHISLARRGNVLSSRLTAYRRLDAVDVAARPFSLGASVSALLLGRDENDYFRATGAELVLQPPDTRSQWYDVRVFAEAQRAVERETDFSVPHLIDGTRDFRPNIAAAAANQAGAVLRLRTTGGQNPESLRWGAEIELHGEVGDYRFARPALRLRASAPLTRRLTLGAEAAGGTSSGDIPAQRLWQLGGATTLRGYDAGSVRGETFWRGRAELGTGLPFARLTLFGDAGWAGPRGGFSSSRPIRSVGTGVSLLDGLVRFDLSHALDAPRGWKLHLQLDGVL